MLEHFASPWNCIYAAKDITADPRAPLTKINGTGPFTFVEHVKGSHVVRQAQRQLLQERPALSRRLQGRVHAAGRRDAQRRPGRPAARRVPRHLAGRARPPGHGHGRQDPHRGVELDAQSPDCLQRREEAVRRRARAQGAAHGDRPLGRQHRPLAHLDAALGRRRDPAGLADGDAGGRAGEAARLLQGHQRLARRGQAPAGGGRRAEPQVHAAQPQPGDALYAGRHLPGRPVAADRRHRRAQAVRHRALSRHHERRQPRGRDRLLQPVHGRTRASASRNTFRSIARRRTGRGRRIPSSTSSTTIICASATSRSARR